MSAPSSVLAQVGHDDLRSARRLDQHHDQKADRAGTRDKDVIVLNWLCQPDRMMRHGERLQKSALLVGHIVRQSIDELLVHADILRKSAVHVKHAEVSAVGADIHRAAFAELTFAAVFHRENGNTVADLEFLHTLAELRHHA